MILRNVQSDSGFQRDDNKCSSLKWTKNHFLLHRHPAMSLDMVLKKTRLFSKKVNITHSLNWSMPYQGGCSQVLISSKGFDSSTCVWKINSPCLGNITSFALSLFE